MTKKSYSLQLGICFGLTLLILAVLGLLTLAFGQDHPFPFKTLQEIEEGTPAWVVIFVGPPQYCPDGSRTLIVKREYQSGAGSSWTVYTDGVLLAGGYFPPGQASPVTVIAGEIKDGKVIITSNVAFDPTIHRPCDPWTQKAA